jgi:predicted membrane-bound spermidine synthase
LPLTETSPTLPEPPQPRAGDYLGLFLIALATLMLEILLTRIFSVTLWYHLAFVAVSIAMFGMTLGAVLVYLGARWFTPARAWLNLSVGAAMFAVTAVASVALHLRMAVNPDLMSSALFDLSRAYGLIAIPFVFSGIVVAIALTSFPRDVGRLYAADLAGAALGCVLLVGVLDWVGGPFSVLVVAAIGGLASLIYALGSSQHVLPRDRWVLAGVVAALLAACAGFLASERGALEIRYAKGTQWPAPIYEKWNSYSRVAIVLDRWEEPFGWGLSARFTPRVPVRQLHLNIDASAETVLTHFREPQDVEHLAYDVTNVGLHVRRGGSVYIIGAGGGRDVVSALTFDARRVVAVELNRAIIEAVNGRYGELTGHLDRRPGVEFVNDEARSYLARTSEKFDFIQISLIDTWAATAAGAFVLSENTLYTVDAWRTFLNSLTDRGIVSISRWYRRPDPYEVYKTVALATTALRSAGVAETRKHLVVIARLDKRPGFEDAPGVGALLASRSPFSESDLDELERVSRELDFDVVLSPRTAATPAFASVADAARVDEYIAATSLDLTPPDDNRPFFFRMDASLLNGLLTFVITLALLLIVVPVLLKADVGAIARQPLLTVGFVAIGLGFMLVEIAQMMRLTLLLGHPTFSLSVVLFGMLLSSGLGSFTTGRIAPHMLADAAARRLGLLVSVLVVLGVVTPWAVAALHTASTPVRVVTALALLAPAGLLMGMAFPLAMTVAARTQPALTPWYWGINGAASVCASVITVAIASSQGIAAAWWTGVACYVVAALAITGSARTAAVR